MKLQNQRCSIIKCMALALMLALGGLSANANGAGSAEKQALECGVGGIFVKHVYVTNRTDRVIAKGTPVNFGDSTGVKSSTAMPKDLKPGRTAIVYIGSFTGSTCQCQIKQQ